MRRGWVGRDIVVRWDKIGALGGEGMKRSGLEINDLRQ